MKYRSFTWLKTLAIFMFAGLALISASLQAQTQPAPPTVSSPETTDLPGSDFLGMRDDVVDYETVFRGLYLQSTNAEGPLSGKRIVVSPGHGWVWGGSGWRFQRSYYWGIVEDKVNAEIAMYLIQYLQDGGADVFPARNPDKNAGNGLTGKPKWEEGAKYHLQASGLPESVWNVGDTDENKDINSRPFFANYVNADLLISIHNNGGGGTGTETWFDPANGSQNSSLLLANSIQRNVVSAVKSRYNSDWADRGVKPSEEYGENKLAKMPSVIAELAFMDRQTPDNAALQDENFKRLLARAIYDGILEYYGVRTQNLAVTPPHYDDIGQVLSRPDLDYEWTQIGTGDLANYQKLSKYHVVFINCAGGLNASPETTQTLRDFVKNGGSVYASDYAYTYVKAAFPEFVRFPQSPRIGVAQDVNAQITDPGLANYIDSSNPPSTIDLKYDLGAWVVIDSVSSDTTVHAKGSFSTTGSSTESDPEEGHRTNQSPDGENQENGYFTNRPLIVSFRPYGKSGGVVVFTTFHNEAQQSDIEKKLLEYLVLNPVTNVYQAAVAQSIASSGLNVKRTDVNTISTGQVSPRYTYRYTRGLSDNRLQCSLAWGGGVLRMSLYRPDGTLYKQMQGFQSPIDLVVPDADPGNWQYQVVGVDVPSENYAYAVGIGSKTIARGYLPAVVSEKQGPPAPPTKTPTPKPIKANRPALESPGNDATVKSVTPKLSWQKSLGADRYQVQVDRSSSFNSPVLSLTTAELKHTPTLGISDGKYLWRVRASSEKGSWSEWSDVWSFSISVLGSTPTPTPPPGTGNWDPVGAGSASGGGVSDSKGDSRGPNLHTAPDGSMWLSWTDDSSGNGEIYVRRWNGSQWQAVGGSASGGGISANAGTSDLPNLALSKSGVPYIAWEDDSSGVFQIYVRYWNGSQWAPVGSGSASGGGISKTSGESLAPKLIVTDAGIPYVCWIDETPGDWEVYVRSFSGGSWKEVGAGSASGGGISNNAGISRSCTLTAGPDGRPQVAWRDDTSGTMQIYGRRWNGTSWVAMGSASGGGISNSPGYSGNPRMIYSPNGNTYLAWHDKTTGNFEIYLKKWNGSSWQEVGKNSASGGGISNTSATSREVNVNYAAGGNPIVAWAEGGNGSEEIYLKRWDGGSWVEVSGSAHGGGISSNKGPSNKPSITTGAGDDISVAWHDESSGTMQIYVRRWQ